MSGQHCDPLRVIMFNPEADRSVDVSHAVAQDILRRLGLGGGDVPAFLEDFHRSSCRRESSADVAAGRGVKLIPDSSMNDDTPKATLVKKGHYSQAFCDEMTDAEATKLRQLHQEIGQAFDAVCAERNLLVLQTFIDSRERDGFRFLR